MGTALVLPYEFSENSEKTAPQLSRRVLGGTGPVPRPREPLADSQPGGRTNGPRPPGAFHHEPFWGRFSANRVFR